MELRRFPVIGLAFCVVMLVGCTGGRDPWADRPGPRVLAYFPPIYSFAASVAGDDAQVRSLITQVGPHHFEPSARDALALRRTDLFFTNGLGLDDSIARKLGDTGNPKLQLVPLGKLIPKESLHEGGCEHCRAHADPKHNHVHEEYDPHVWLGITEAQRMIAGIGDALATNDPAHADAYRSRAEAAKARLDKLQAEGKALLAAKSEKPKLISFHDSLFYFARSFDIEVVDNIEIPGQEPSPKKLQQLIDTCKKNGVRLIAVEPQYASRNDAARIIVNELKRHGIDAAFVELDPLETASPEDLTPDFYERKMRANLTNLAGALK